MSKSTEDLVKAISKPKKSNSKPFIERATNWVTTNVIPYLALAFMAIATADSVIQRSKQLDKLTDMQRGALSLFVVWIVFYFAVKAVKKSKK